jgi:hypothetical protein
MSDIFEHNSLFLLFLNINPRGGNIYETEGVESLLRSVSAQKHRTVVEFKRNPRCSGLGCSSTGENKQKYTKVDHDYGTIHVQDILWFTIPSTLQEHL